MLKATDALAAAGYEVTAVATRHEPWATGADADVRSRRSWPVRVVDYRRQEGAGVYWSTGVEHRAAIAAIGALGPGRAPLSIARPSAACLRWCVPFERARRLDLRRHDRRARGDRRSRTANLQAACPRPRRFHSAETSGRRKGYRRARSPDRVRHPAGAAFLTTSSEAIARAYRERYDVKTSVVHNTFPLPLRPPDFSRRDPAVLRVYWFSQTIGPGRGLEEAIAGFGRAGICAELTLRGQPHDGYLDGLEKLAAAQAPNLRLVYEPPAPPDAMVDLARFHDVGLALEYGRPLHRALCLTNKVFTYMLAGLAIIGFDTPGQHDLGVDVGRAAALVPQGDVDALAAALRGWHADPAALECARRAAWAAASGRWHWEHDAERGTLYRLVEEALS